MKDVWKEMLLAVMMGFVVPGLLLGFAAAVLIEKEEENVPASGETTETAESAALAEPLSMRLRREDGSVEEMDMDAYLVGVVLGEMPAYFEPEALKAQAVVARTYTQKAYVTGGKHGDGSVCTDSTCCQAYVPENSYDGTQEETEKIRTAVQATSGMVLTYEGQLIEATYFSCSGGSTEDAAAVWGTDFPYLRAVSSPGEEDATHYRDTATFTEEELEEKLGITLEGAPEDWVGTAFYTAGGGVATISIGGVEFEGTQLRQKLGLRSTAFTVTAAGSSLTITTKGFGHRVGMSQFGADAMAAKGSSYEEILAYYYQGTVLEQYTMAKKE